MEKLINNIEKWGEAKDFVFYKNRFQQVCKLMEELKELEKGYQKDDTFNIIDAIGDVQVVLILLCKMLDIDFLSKINKPRRETDLLCCVGNLAESVIKNNKEDQEQSIIDILSNISDYAIYCGLTLQDCLSTAYNEIKNRTGKTINGTFIKDEVEK